MRRSAALLSIIGIFGSLLAASTATANPPARFTFSIDDTFPSFLSGVCGFDVLIHLEGTSTATLFVDKTGAIVREIDTNPNLKITFSAPSEGTSFTFPAGGAFVQEYINGTAVGSAALATLTGLINGTGSGPPDAGRIVANVVVVDTTPEGIPIVDFVSEIASSGHRNADLAAARCAALSGP